MSITTALSENKSEFRHKILKQIKSLSASDLQSLSEQIQKNLQELFSTLSPISAGLWGAYLPLATEPRIDFAQVNSALQTAQTAKIKWAYPKTSASGMDFYSDVDVFTKATNGVREPQTGKRIQDSELSGICVPALAYHTNGYRLGRGAGFYDRHFAKFQGKKIGVCFDFCFTSAVPYEAHDIKMNYVVTDNKIYTISQMEKN